MAGRALDAVPAVAERNLVQIRFEDLVLGVVLLHLASGGLLVELPAEAAVGAVDEGRVHVPDELLGDGAGAAPFAEDVVLESTGDADDVDAVVLVEAMILDRDERVRQIRGQRLDRDTGADLLPDLADQRPIAREDERRLGHWDDSPGYAVACPGLLRAQDRSDKQKRRAKHRAERLIVPLRSVNFR